MIFWIFVMLMVVGISLIVVDCKRWDYEKYPFLYDYDETICGWGVATTIVSGVVVLIMLLVVTINNVTASSMVAENHERYKALTYKLESGACRDEFGLLNKEIIDEIQEWNEDVAYYQVAQDNFWVGIFYPNVYDQFETIDYTKYNTNDIK